MTRFSLARFYRELKRRKVIRVAVAYAVVAWLLVEITSVMFPELLLPDWSVRLVIALLIVGFPVALVLAWAFDMTPDGLKAEAAAPAPEAEAAPPAAAVEPERPASEFRSVAVLPFLNLSNDPDNEYFSDGISEELLNLLCKLPQLTVASRTSSFSFKGKDVDMRTVASRLGVDVILEGSVRRSGERVRITAQLIDGVTDRHLWSETYDRELTDVFAVQDEIAQNIVQALELSLTRDQKKLIQREPNTDSIDAYDFYLRGRYYVERGDVDSGQQMFEKAIEVDENYALAWAGAADCHSWRCMWYESSPESRRLADEFSRKALELAPDLAEAHASRSYAMTASGRYAEAESSYKKAIELDPQLYEAYYYGGRAYFTQGRFQEAMDAFARAASLRPDDPTAIFLKCTSLQALDRGDIEAELRECIAVCERHLALNPDDALTSSRISAFLVDVGEIDRGLEFAERALSINPDFCRYNVACAYLRAGKVDEALDLLQEHAETCTLQKDWLANDTDWDTVRDHPRFKVIEEMLASTDGDNRP